MSKQALPLMEGSSLNKMNILDSFDRLLLCGREHICGRCLLLIAHLNSISTLGFVLAWLLIR